jgi:hypothetical protein
MDRSTHSSHLHYMEECAVLPPRVKDGGRDILEKRKNSCPCPESKHDSSVLQTIEYNTIWHWQWCKTHWNFFFIFGLRPSFTKIQTMDKVPKQETVSVRLQYNHYIEYTIPVPTLEGNVGNKALGFVCCLCVRAWVRVRQSYYFNW